MTLKTPVFFIKQIYIMIDSPVRGGLKLKLIQTCACEETMFKIGEFSKMGNVSIKTLRYYDEIGLMKPALIDEISGYRIYSADQLSVLHQIKVLKDSGCTLDEINQLIHESTGVREMIFILEKKVLDLEKKILDDQERIQRLRTNIFLMKNGGVLMNQEILIKKVEPICVASYRKVIGDFEEMGEMWELLNREIDQLKGKKTLPCMTLYYNGWDTQKGIDVEVIEPLFKAIEGTQLMKVYELEAVDKMASIVHNGPFETIADTYKILEAWIENQGYSLVGPVREIYHKGDWLTSDPNEYVTEIQMPIA